MKRKETYLSRDFRETVALRFPARAKELNTAFDMRLSALLAENADASKEKQYHLQRQRIFQFVRDAFHKLSGGMVIQLAIQA